MKMTKCSRSLALAFAGVLFTVQLFALPGVRGTDKKDPTNPEDNEGLAYIYDIDSLPHVYLSIKPADWDSLLFAYDKNPNANYYIPADFTFYKGDNVHSFSDVGIRLRGNSSRRRPEGDSAQYHNPIDPQWHHASFTINMDKYVDDQTFFDEEKINLKWVREDSTYIRELYAYDLYRKYGLYVAPFCSFCRLTINVEGDRKPAYYGVYKLIEEVDDVFISHRTATFGDDDGYIWKANNGADFKNPDRTLMGVSDDTFEPVYDLKNHSKHVDEASDQLINFINSLITLEGDDLKAWAEDAMDVELFLKTYAISVMVGNWDDYWVNSNNFYFYFNDDDGKFFFIPYDFDAVLGTSSVLVPNGDSGTQDILNWGGDNPLVRKLISIPEYKDIYVSTCYEISDPTKDLFHYAASADRIRGWWNQIESYVGNDTNEDMELSDAPAWWSNQQRYRVLDPSQDKNYFRIRVDNLPPNPSEVQ